jgi:hypothetical protein
MATVQQTSVSPTILKELEAASGLKVNGTNPNLSTFQTHGNQNQYAAYLDILVNGKKALNANWNIDPSDPPYLITRDRYISFVKWLTENHLMEGCQSLTPAGQRGELVTGGLLGINARSTGNMPMNAMTGPGQNTPCLGADLLNSIDPNMVNNIENICNIIRTKSYFTLPASAFGSLQTLLYQAQGAVQGFVQYLYNIYHGVILLLQRFAAMVNGLLASISQMIYDFIASLIPLDLLCAILGAFQSLLDDVAFFAQLFNGGDGLFNAINSIQTVVNYAAQGLAYAYNPMSLLNLIPGVGNVMAQFQQVLNDPEAFMGNLISHFNIGIASNNKALQIANAIILHYGLEGQLGPLGPILLQGGVAGNNSQWYRTGNLGTGDFGKGLGGGGIGNLAIGNIAANPGYFDPDNPLGFLDVNSNPYFAAARTNLSDFTNNAKNLPGAVANFVTNPLG